MNDETPFSPPEQDAPLPPSGSGTTPELQRWPRIFGIISMVLAANALLLSPLLLWANKANPQTRRFQDLLPAWYETFTNYSMVLGMAFGAMLLVAGLKLRRQQKTGRTLHRFYAAGNLLMVLVGAVATTNAFGAINTDSLGGAERAGVVGGMIGGILGTIVGAAYPIFLLIWFNRQKIREDVEMWVED